MNAAEAEPESEHVMPMPAVSTAARAEGTSTADHSTAAMRGVSFNKRVLTLLAMGCVVGMIAGWARGGPRETRFRLFNKPMKARPSVLVPPGPAPRLIPGDSPNATRASWSRSQVPRQTAAGATRSGIDYLAAFADSVEAIEDAR